MYKFYPDDRDKVNKLRWYSNKRIFSFGVRNMWLTGGRGFGKTFSTKKYRLKNFMKNKETFAWVRTTDTTMDMIRDPLQFFGRFKPQDFKELEIEKYDIKNDKIIINGKRAGYLFAVSTFYKVKGADYDCTSVTWDEFIKAKGERPLAGKFDMFMDLCQSILRDTKNQNVIGLSNSTNKYDEVLKHYNVNLKDFGVYLIRQENALIHYAAPSNTFINAQKDSVSYLSMSESQKDVTFGNKFIDHGIYDKMSKATYLYSVQVDDDSFYSIYSGSGKFYVKPSVPENPYMKTMNPSFVNKYVTRIKPVEKKMLVNMYDRGDVIFFDGFCRGLFQESIL